MKKNIQVIDGARNCTYSIFAAEPGEFIELFPGDQDIAFSDEIFERLGEKKAQQVLKKIWDRPVWKASVQGVHGTLFFDLSFKKEFYAARREADLDDQYLNNAQRKLFQKYRR